MVAPEHVRHARETAAEYGIENDIIIDDVQR